NKTPAQSVNPTDKPPQLRPSRRCRFRPHGCAARNRHARDTPDLTDRTIIAGVGARPGIVEGLLPVVTDPDDDVEPGDIVSVDGSTDLVDVIKQMATHSDPHQVAVSARLAGAGD
ncbi:hypothetical protein, partial [Mycobacterium heckeshornense]|uniref:hypothetical protein n=1 Tax=Mycobacterium heckeshornense TaxID=110505 RepID=UPI000AA2D646